MATAETLPFSWHSVESLPDLERLRLVLATLPDEEIVAALEAGRGRGRNDYPVSAMWRALIAGVVFQHPSIQSLLRELGRNPALLELCGIEALPFQGAPLTELRAGTQGPPCAVTHPARVRSTVPSHWNVSRFLTGVVQLEDKQGLVSAMIESLRSSLFEEVPDFGRHLGYDGKAIESHSTGRVAEGKKDASDPDADWGKHETSGVNARTGKIWKKVKSWFGYGLHLIADTHYEVPVAFEVTRASRTETKVLAEMLEGLFAEAPEMVDRCDDFSADRGLDNAPQKKQLGATSATVFSSTPCRRTRGSRITRRGAMRPAVSCRRRRSSRWSRRSVGTSMTAMSRVSKRAPAALAIPCRRLRTRWPASSAAKSRTGPDRAGAKCRRHGTPAATATARSSARMDLPHLGSPPTIPTSCSPHSVSTSHCCSRGRSSSSIGARVGKPVMAAAPRARAAGGRR